MTRTARQILFGWSGHEEWDERYMGHAGVREEVLTGFCWGDLEERDHLEDLGLEGKRVLKWVIKKGDVGMEWIDLRSVLVWDIRGV